jgi:hypothetical protein
VDRLDALRTAPGLGWRGRSDNGSAVAPVNAPSHWVWGDEALRQDAPSWRYTGLGVVIHQASAVMWGLLYEWLWQRRRLRATVPQQLRDAAVATAAAATIDLVLTPRRFTPGFERRLSPAGLAWTYGAFAVGVAVGGYVARRGWPGGRAGR